MKTNIDLIIIYILVISNVITIYIVIYRHTFYTLTKSYRILYLEYKVKFWMLIGYKPKFKILEFKVDPVAGCYTMQLDNEGITWSGNTLLYAIYNTLYEDPLWLACGDNKIIFLVGELQSGDSRSLYYNSLVKNTFTFTQFLEVIPVIIEPNNLESYNYQNVNIIIVSTWDVDKFKGKKITKYSKDDAHAFKIKHNNSHIRKFSTGAHPPILDIGNNNKINKYNNNKFFTPYAKPVTKLLNFATLDIETINIGEGMQFPILVTFYSYSTKKVKYFKVDLLALDKYKNNKIELKKLEYAMWEQFCYYLAGLPDKNLTIFTHNLGSFDGMFLFSGLSNIFYNTNIDINKFNKIDSMVDSDSKFIQIKCSIAMNYLSFDINKCHKGKKLELKHFIFKDSNRIFNLSLSKLCAMYNVTGKFSNYNKEHNKIGFYHNLNTYRNFIRYSKQDCSALYYAMLAAQQSYFNTFKVDLVKSVSASSLALRIFRTNFMSDFNIPVLNSDIDRFVRQSYLGGMTNYFQRSGETLYYYDINSLYPFCMRYKQPLAPIKYHKFVNNLNNFFGFCLADLYCPKDLIPVIPFKHEGKTIYPHGSFRGIYFSEELKAARKLGYTVKCLGGWEFSSKVIFSEYVDFLYEMKKKSTGSERYVAKMSLNSLYGLFGRKLDTHSTIIVKNNKLVR